MTSKKLDRERERFIVGQRPDGQLELICNRPGCGLDCPVGSIGNGFVMLDLLQMIDLHVWAHEVAAKHEMTMADWRAGKQHEAGRVSGDALLGAAPAC